ncbi:hypothetical protein DL766_005110 [Monosporascus sp. MC13-8B]|nr:hypothetical protein DL766_005110 [Monosporascus sp. MC13-8B]
MSADTELASAPICSEDRSRIMQELAEHEGRAAALRKALADYMANKELDEAAERLANVTLLSRPASPKFDFSFEGLRGAQEAQGVDLEVFRLKIEKNDDLRNIARAAGVNYIALHGFVISDEAHAFAYEFIHDSDLGKYTSEAWHELWETQERLRWLQAEVTEGRYGDNSDLTPWVIDGPCFDKRHFVMADYITRFVLLCENFRLRSGKEEWASELFGRPEARVEMYKRILLLFIKKEEGEMTENARRWREAEALKSMED